MTELHYEEVDSPIGAILLAADGEALCALDYAGCEARMRELLRSRYGDVKLTSGASRSDHRSRLGAYFTGDFAAVNSIRIRPGGTAFQQSVWNAFRAIPAGKTMSYGEIAAGIGAPRAARAVGLANARNPIAIVVPCHRVIGASGALTGYAGGLDRKRWLLSHEGARPGITLA
jgi:methylated-DNA-[protein]-cysteine S-methyltransferase